MPAAPFVLRVGATLFLLLASFACSSTTSDADRAALEKQFEESMRNVVLDGSFTVTRDGETSIHKDKYTIESVSRMGGDVWVFKARIQYGEHDVTLPVPVKLLWAGDTPVVTLTDATIPGLGTFTARVLFYRDSYAGFWQHGDVSGNQFGRIIHAGEGAPDANEKAPDAGSAGQAPPPDRNEAAPKSSAKDAEGKTN